MLVVSNEKDTFNRGFNHVGYLNVRYLRGLLYEKSFLTSLSLLAATLAADASAALPSDVVLKMPEMKTNEQIAASLLFVLDKPDNNGGLFVA